jgi:hypothetical protein
MPVSTFLSGLLVGAGIGFAMAWLYLAIFWLGAPPAEQG